MKLIDVDTFREEHKMAKHCGDCRRSNPQRCAQQIYSAHEICVWLDFAKIIEAEPVRRGRWVQVYGYATLGGDPAWKCSECGKGVHVYGIEHGTYGADVSDGQWVACPNCGAKMEEEDDGEADSV